MTLAMQTRLPPTISENPTIWGLAPAELHDRYWAARGVFAVRPGQRGDIPDDAELCMLVDSRTLAIFRMSEVIETMSWIKPLILFVRIVDKHDDEYREQVLTDKHGRFIRFKRFYGCGTTRCIARVAFTRNRKIAKTWQATVDPRASWRNLREQARTVRRESVKLDGKAYDRKSDDDVSRLVFDLIEHWRHPSATLPIKKLAPHVWAPRDFMIDPTVKIFGPAWIGAGRILPAGASVLGPAALWDNPTSQPTVHNLVWSDLEPTRALLLTQAIDRNKRFSVYHMTKRLFDIISALIGLLLTLPLIPLVMLAIWLEDGSRVFADQISIDAKKRRAIAPRSRPAEQGRWPAILHARRSAHHARRQNHSPLEHRRDSAVRQRIPRPHVARRPAAKSAQRKPILPALARSTIERSPRNHRPVASHAHAQRRPRFSGMDSLRPAIRRARQLANRPANHLQNFSRSDVLELILIQ